MLRYRDPMGTEGSTSDRSERMQMSVTTPQVPEVRSYVGGSWREGTRELPDTSPADPSTVLAVASMCDAAVASDAVAAAAAAAEEWGASRPEARATVLRRAADLLDERAPEIARDLTREEGKTLAESLREAQLSARVMRHYAGQVLEPSGESYPSQQQGVLLLTRREPLGVVSVITPWNFPLAIPSWKIAPALAFGNTVVWKPAELVPLTARHLLTALTDAGLPDGVLNLVIGKGSEVGDVLATHRAVEAVTFTGSNAVGRHVQSKAAETGKKVQLEMGGKNPAVVLPDADLDRAAAHIAVAAFGGTGQKCTATSRVIVHRSITERLLERLAAEAKAWKAGDPLDPDVTLGPLASRDQFDTVVGHVDGALGQGARAVVGGDRVPGAPEGGYFVTPTVLTDVQPDFGVARDEVFGPVVAVFDVESYDEAVALANDTPYGLSASIYTRDLGKAMRFTHESRTGVVKVNQPTSANEFHVPFGGHKDSGVGEHELGKSAQHFYTESKTISIALPEE